MNVPSWLWKTRGGSPARPQPEARAEPTDLPRRAMSGDYRLLHRYLDDRYADTVVLTFAEIEDLLGFALPDQARRQNEWWTDRRTGLAGPHHSDCWTLARRTAVPNLLALNVVFERYVPAGGLGSVSR